MDAAETRFAVSDSWVSTKAPICGKSQRLSLFSERHQQERRGSCYWSTSSPRLPLRTGWSVLICCPIRVMLFNTHTPPTHVSYYCRVCSCLPVLLTPLGGLPSCQLLPPNTNTKTGIIVWAGWSILFKIQYQFSLTENILNQHICTVYCYSKVMTGFLSEFPLAVWLTK